VPVARITKGNQTTGATTLFIHSFSSGNGEQGSTPDVTTIDIGLFAIFAVVLLGPFLWKKIEQNLEPFLFICGAAAATVASVWNWALVRAALEEPLIKGIVPAVLVAGLVFHFGKERIHGGIMGVLRHIPLRLFVFLMIVGLGLMSSVITAIIAALLLVEITYVLPLDRRRRVEMVIISCFSIGLGAVLTPLGEPLSTIAIAALQGPPHNAGFFFLLFHLGVYVLPGLVVFGVIGALLVGFPRPRALEKLLFIRPHEAPLPAAKATTAAALGKPGLVLVKASEGFEREAAAELAGRAELRGARVNGVLVPEGLPGHVIVETEDPSEVAGLLVGARHAKSVVKPVPGGPDIPGLLESRILETDPAEGEIVELVGGLFKGQTGKVVGAERPDGTIQVELHDSHIVVPVRETGAQTKEAPAGGPGAAGESCQIEPEKLSEVFLRSGKVYLFVMALLLLGGGMKVVIDKYFVNVPAEGLYWANTVSAVLDNATLTAAEIGKNLRLDQIISALMALLIAGGMLIPGNIPNIIAANKLKIGSREWARLGIPLGFGAMLVYFLWLFYVPLP
jgi:transcription elongation factor Spt5